MTFKEMQTELRKQKPHHPDPKAWEGISLVNSVAETQAWLDRLADVTPQPKPEAPPALAFPVDQYIDDEERTRAWLKGTDMRGAEKWIHSTLPTAYHVMTEFAAQMHCSFQVEIKPAMHIPGAYMLTVEIHKEIDGDIDTMALIKRADSKDEIPVVQAITCRNLFVEYVGRHSLRKANEAYRKQRGGE